MRAHVFVKNNVRIRLKNVVLTKISMAISPPPAPLNSSGGAHRKCYVKHTVNVLVGYSLYAIVRFVIDIYSELVLSNPVASTPPSVAVDRTRKGF